MHKSILKSLTFIAIASIILTGCGRKDDSNLPPSLAQIQREQGVPVRITTAQIQPITEIRKYSGGIQGADMTMIKAPVSERIVKLPIRVGSFVRKDQVVVELETDGNSPNYQNAKQGLELLEKTYERMLAVYEKGGITKQQLDEVEMQLKTTRTNFEKLTKATSLTSTETGVVTDIFFKLGNTVEAGSYIASISKIDKLLLMLNITSEEIHRFKKGMDSYIKVGNETIYGKVTEVPLAANPMTRFFPVEVTFQNKDRLLLPNMFVDAYVNLRTDTTLCVPNHALLYEHGRHVVYKVKDNIAEKVVVKTGITSTNITQITEGLDPEDTIVLEGFNNLQSGAKIKVIP
ncbi:MAG: efflux RND transporter periplasmic adaptor subunit [Fibrobacter sp.]|mgnify:CR=1 FL=1|nr:efflux RND transporter periplasmic adaptor subunit [Fibrobacter sp.]